MFKQSLFSKDKDFRVIWAPEEITKKNLVIRLKDEDGTSSYGWKFIKFVKEENES